jgi:nucleoside-diphosphate-sugar epimerase
MQTGSEQQLEELLSRPSEADRDAIQRLEGDLLILGAGGKMGPSLARRARRAALETGVSKKIIAVARFSIPTLASQLESDGIEVIQTDLLAPGALDRLPDCSNVIFMAARKFGTQGNEHLTWAMNSYLPGKVAERYAQSRIVAFSTGNVYPLSPIGAGGSAETDPAAPAGEYAQSALARERIFEYWSSVNGTPVALLRLNYAIDLRYGILVDIASKVLARHPVNVTMPVVNVIWQGDANSICLRAFDLAQSPPFVLNVTGPETVSVRRLAMEFGRRLGLEPLIEGEESPTALLSNASLCHKLFGYPSVTLGEMIERVAGWIASGGVTLGKPTRFEERAGRF